MFPKKPGISIFTILVLFILLTAFFRSKIPEEEVYPPLFSKKFPLSTPISFWASTLGMRRLASDIVWIQALQYYGTEDNSKPSELQFSKDKDFSKYYPYLKYYWQQIIRFDPLFINVHLIGATTLAWNLKRYDEAMELMNEGIAVINNISMTIKDMQLQETDEKHVLLTGKGSYFEQFKRKLYILKAVLLFLHQEKFDEAIPLLETMGSRDDSPDVIKVMLAQVYEEKKYYVKAIKLWLNIYSTTKNESRKIRAAKNINELNALISTSDTGINSSGQFPRPANQ